MGKLPLLVVDDDDGIRGYLAALLSAQGYEVVLSATAEDALARLGRGLVPAVVLLDLILPGMDGLEALGQIKEIQPRTPVIILSTVGQIKTAVEAMRRGAADYLAKPFQEEELELAIEQVLETQRLRDEVRDLRQRLADDPDSSPTSNPRMSRLKEIADQVADTDAPVLILGETGVGKEVMARYIHQRSSRRDRPFVKVNCAALPHDLLESELFGYERGAFSGALRDKPGKFELANKGSILLDEIGDMSPALQAKILHVLQDGECTRLGGRQPLRTDARVMASTNRPLDRAVADGSFREDLFFRLNVIRLELPPLRDRLEDVPVLVQHFLQRYAQRYQSPHHELPAALIEAFLRHRWPGNVRELENAVRRYVLLPDLGMALAELASPAAPPVREPSAPPAEPPRRQPGETRLSLKKVSSDAADRAEQELVRRVLTETRWNRREAARRLQISYKGLLNKLKKWRVDEEGDGARPSPSPETRAPRRVPQH